MKSRFASIGNLIIPSLFLVLSTATPTPDAVAADWPTYLQSHDRAGVTSEPLVLPLRQAWVRKSAGPPRRAWSAAEGKNVEGRDIYDRVRFDDALQVAVVGEHLYYGSSVDHRLVCVDTKTGKERWSFFTGAAIRLAPTVLEKKVYAGSDDGYAYCVDADTGELIWKYRPGPADEWFLGRGEMISRWPIRTGILIDDGVAYFGAGIFPHENVYVCAVNSESGKVIWRNDNISHQEAGREDLSPQGYLLASSEHIYVPSGRTRPKSFDRKTGELLGSGMAKIDLSTAVLTGTNAIMLGGRAHHYSPGAHVAGTAEACFATNGTHLARVEMKSFGKISKASGQLRNEQRTLFRKQRDEATDEALAQQQSDELRLRFQSLDEENVQWRTACEANSALVVAGKHVFVGGENEVTAYDAESGEPVWKTSVDGDARGLAIANGRLFVSTSNGNIIAFDSTPNEAVTQTSGADAGTEPFPADEWTERYRAAAAGILKRTGVTRGFCLVADSDDGRLA